jgi:CheY-like chemotaxis protein
MSISTSISTDARPAPTTAANVLIVDDHDLVATSLALYLRSEGLLAQRHAARSRDGVLTAAATLNPGVVLLDRRRGCIARAGSGGRAVGTARRLPPGCACRGPRRAPSRPAMVMPVYPRRSCNRPSIRTESGRTGWPERFPSRPDRPVPRAGPRLAGDGGLRSYNVS